MFFFFLLLIKYFFKLWISEDGRRFTLTKQIEKPTSNHLQTKILYLSAESPQFSQLNNNFSKKLSQTDQTKEVKIKVATTSYA